MGSYTDASGKTVRFTDADTLQQAMDLYQFIDHDYKGSDSVDAKRLEYIIGKLSAGMPMGGMDWDILDAVKEKVGPEFDKWQGDGRDGQDAAILEGSGRIKESLSGLDADSLRLIREAGKEYGGTPSATPQDRKITAAHLHDSILHDLGHTVQHIKRIMDPDVTKSPDSIKFNAEHALHHAESAQEHGKKLDQHLRENPTDPNTWAVERDLLQKAREATRKIVKEDSAPRPPNLVNSTNPAQCCGTCKMFSRNQCWGYGNYPVTQGKVCDSWSKSATFSMIEAEKLTRDTIRNTNAATVAEPEVGQPTVCVDFDGVIHLGPHGLPGAVNGSLMPGTIEALQKIRDMGYSIVILTARVDLEAVRDWLKKNGLGKIVDEVTNNKPSASAYIDDRATHFTSWPNAVKAVDPLTPVHEHPQVGDG